MSVPVVHEEPTLFDRSMCSLHVWRGRSGRAKFFFFTALPVFNISSFSCCAAFVPRKMNDQALKVFICLFSLKRFQRPHLRPLTLDLDLRKKIGVDTTDILMLRGSLVDVNHVIFFAATMICWRTSTAIWNWVVLEDLNQVISQSPLSQLRTLLQHLCLKRE